MKFNQLKEKNGEKMFKSLNNEMNLSERIDLHGLHTTEALSYLNLAI